MAILPIFFNFARVKHLGKSIKVEKSNSCVENHGERSYHLTGRKRHKSMIEATLRTGNSLELVRFVKDSRRFVGLHFRKVLRSGNCLISNWMPVKFMMLRRRIGRSWRNYLRIGKSMSVTLRACDMVLLVD